MSGDDRVDWGKPSDDARRRASVLDAEDLPELAKWAADLPARPRSFRLVYEKVHLAVTVTLIDVYGAPEIVGIEIAPQPGKTGQTSVISARLLAGLPLRELKQVALAFTSAVDNKALVARLRRAAAAQHGPGQARHASDHYDLVADVYRAAQDEGSPTIAAVENAFGVSKKTAERYIRDAREGGALEPSKRSKVTSRKQPGKRGSRK